MLRYDVYLDGEVAFIYPTGDVDRYGFLPEAKPLKVTSCFEWKDYCFQDGEEDYDRVRVFQRYSYCLSEYVRDMEKVANELMQKFIDNGKKNGWGELYIDSNAMVYTLRLSADWENQPTYYTFDTTLSWTEKDGEDRHNALLYYSQVLGIARAVHELGWNVAFDKSFKIYIKGASWRRVDD